MDNRLAAGNERERHAGFGMGARNAPQKGAGLARLAAQRIGQEHGFVAERFAGIARGAAQFPHAAGNLCLGITKRFRRLRAQQLLRGIGQVQAVGFRDLQRLRARRGVRARGAGGDHVERIAQNVREHDRKHARRRAVCGEAAALDGRKALAHRVHLDDIGTAL